MTATATFATPGEENTSSLIHLLMIDRPTSKRQTTRTLLGTATTVMSEEGADGADIDNAKEPALTLVATLDVAVVN